MFQLLLGIEKQHHPNLRLNVLPTLDSIDLANTYMYD